MLGPLGDERVDLREPSRLVEVCLRLVASNTMSCIRDGTVDIWIFDTGRKVYHTTSGVKAFSMKEIRPWSILNQLKTPHTSQHRVGWLLHHTSEASHTFLQA